MAGNGVASYCSCIRLGLGRSVSRKFVRSTASKFDFGGIGLSPSAVCSDGGRCSSVHEHADVVIVHNAAAMQSASHWYEFRRSMTSVLDESARRSSARLAFVHSGGRLLLELVLHCGQVLWPSAHVSWQGLRRLSRNIRRNHLIATSVLAEFADWLF